jgi:GT2 family glycosyltransferase
MKYPLISIITVNYNGKRFLDDFLTAVKKFNYPKNKYEMIVVDNGSNDFSIKYLKDRFPWVKVVISKKNIGFGAGNNLGIDNAKGDLVLLLNNDTLPDKNILINLLELYESLSLKYMIGAINCKMVLIDRYINLRVEDAVLNKVVANSFKSIEKNYQKMTHDEHNGYHENIYIPCGTNPGNGKITLLFSKLRKNDFTIDCGDMKIQNKFINNKDCVVEININKQNFVDLIQNAGSVYFRDGYGRDRGVVVSSKRQYYEEDKGQYDLPEEVLGFCGAGVLINKKYFYQVKGFDEDFFMYYEDGDLSFKLKKKGYKIYYCPKAVVRHIHAGSSKEWSNFFLYHAERGRLLFLSKHWPPIIAISELIKYIINDTLLVPLYYLLRLKEIDALDKIKLRLRVFKSVFIIYVINLFKKDKMTFKEYYKLL